MGANFYLESILQDLELTKVIVHKVGEKLGVFGLLAIH
jgi:hypothetical protein